MYRRCTITGMNNEIKTQMESLFQEAQKSMKRFQKKSYEEDMKRLYASYRGMLEKIISVCEADETQKDNFLEESGSYIANYVKVLYEQAPSKRKKEMLMLDWNMAMVTYVTPVINYNRNPFCEELGSRMIRQWNETFPGASIQSATYEKIDAGFKRKLCYVTTAVCESLGKADDCRELALMRNYRDEYLLKTAGGEDIVEEYYNIAPTIVKHISRREDAKEIYAGIWETYLNPCIQMIEAHREKECQEVYTDMVNNLKKKYLYS